MAAVTFVAAGAIVRVDGGAPTSAIYSSPSATAGNLLVLKVYAAIGASVLTALAAPTGWSIAENPAAGAASGGYGAKCAIFYKNAAGGVETATLNFGSNGSFVVGRIEENTPGTLGNHTHTTVNSGANSGGTGSVSNLATGAMAHIVICPDNGIDTNTLATIPPSGYTDSFNDPNNSVHVCGDAAYKAITGTGSQSGSWTWAGTAGPYNAAIAIFEPPGGGGVTAALTAVSSTDTPGTVTPSVDKALAGTSSTDTPGTMVPTVSLGLTGTTETGTPGSLVPSVSKGLTGLSLTGTGGTVSPAADKGLTGTTGTGSPGSVTATPTSPLTGVSEAGSAGSVTPSAAAALTGATGTGAAGQPGVAVTLALTGVTTTGSVGSVTTALVLAPATATGSAGQLAPATDTAVTGVSAAGSVGSVTATPTLPLGGVSETGSAGSVTPSAAAALTGASSTAAPGTVSPALATGVTGVSGTGTPGSVTAGAASGVTGTTGTGAAGQPGVSVTIGLTGVSTAGSAGTVTPATGATAALTGTTLTGLAGSVGLDVTVGLTGVTTTGKAGSVAIPSPVGPGSNGLRRWLIQQYTEYFEGRELQKKRLLEAPKPRLAAPRPQQRAGLKPGLTEVSSETELEAALRIADQLVSGSFSLAQRVTALEKTPKIRLQPLPRIISTAKATPREQPALADDEDELLLLALLFDEGN